MTIYKILLRATVGGLLLFCAGFLSGMFVMEKANNLTCYDYSTGKSSTHSGVCPPTRIENHQCLNPETGTWFIGIPDCFHPAHKDKK